MQTIYTYRWKNAENLILSASNSNKLEVGRNLSMLFFCDECVEKRRIFVLPYFSFFCFFFRQGKPKSLVFDPKVLL